jgi:N12 class adenine-specific DNA methylase/adenine-specific DNA methylase
MPNKLQAYAEQAERTARQITGSHLAWTAFLTTAARLYKYPYNEQLMIYMQRPEATACAEYDFWNEKMGRYVRRGSTGIALIDASGYKPRLKYVFDVSDTGGKENARRVNLWELKDAHTDGVSAMLERNYGVSGKNGLAEQFERVASQLAAEYWRDHSRDILGIVADSYLEEYDDYNIEVAFKNAAAVSITYSLMSRCGMQPEDHFEHEDFFSIFDFNTPRTVAALGTAVSEINEQVLRQIEVTIRNYEREHSAERTAEHGEQPDLHEERRLHDSRPEDRGAGAAPRQVRTDAPEVPEGASPHSLESDDLGGEPVPAPAGDRAGGAEPSGADDAGAGGGGRSDGSAESQRSHEMGGPDEHLQGAGGGSDSRGADLRITEHPARGGQLSFFPTEAEQIASIEEAESVAHTPFAFSVSQEQLDHVLRLGGNSDDTRMVIAAAFQKQKSTEDIAALLQSTFHGGNGFKTPGGELSAWYAVDGIHIAPGRSAEYVRSAQVITWQDAAVRISQLMDSGAYASNVELAEAGQHERMQLAQALWYLKHDLSDEAREQGYLSCMDTLRGGGFPDETARLAEQLTNTDFRDTLSGEFAQFYAAHEQDRSLLRFHYHKLNQIWQSLRELSLPRRAYSSEMAAVPELGRFITADEVDHALDRGSGVEGGKGRIYEYFTADHTGKEKAAFLKDEYGIGGHTHAVSGASGSYEDHSAKGITLKKAGCANVELSWTKVAARIDSLIQKNRFLSPREKERYAQLQREKDAERELPVQAQNEYNAIKEAHPDDIVLFQVGDFFEMYGEDAKQAAELLDMNLTTRNIPGAGRVAMCGVPSHNLEMYVEKLRDKYDVTIAEAPDFRGERHIHTLRSIDHEAEAAIDAYEAEFGADGTRVFRDPAAEQPQPTVAELFEGYKLTVGNALVADDAFLNACRNSDRENAYLEGAAAIRRIVTESGDLQLTRLYFDMPAFHNRLHQELLDELYPTLATTVTPSPYKVTQADIDAALQQWNGRIESKHAVVRYMKAHARDRDTAAWLAREYGLKDISKPLQISVGNSEPVTLSWAKVQRRIAQLIQSDNFYTEQEQDNFDNIDPIAIREALAERGIVGGRIVDAEANRNSLFIRQVMADVERIAAQEAQAAYMDSPDRFSIRLHPNEGGITGIWDSALDRFYEEGGQVLRFAEQSNAIDYLSSIQRSRGMEPDAPVFTTPLGNAYRVGDGFSSTAAEQRDTLMVVERVDEDNVWYTLPSVPEQETVSVDRTVFERYLDTGYFFAAEQTQPVKEVTAENKQENMIFRAPYAVGDTVYLDNTPFEITEVGALNVQLRDPALRYPVFRAESRENFERLLRRDERNATMTDFLPARNRNDDLRDLLMNGILTPDIRDEVRELFRQGEGNAAIGAYLSNVFAVSDADTMTLEDGTEADFITSRSGFQAQVHGEKGVHALGLSWPDAAPVLRAVFLEEAQAQGRTQAQAEQTISVQEPEVSQPEQTPPEVAKPEQPQFTTETVAFYPGEKNHLPFDIEIQTIRTTEPEIDPPAPLPPAENFRILDDDLGTGGAKAKFRANMAAINLLKELEFEGLQASPEQQEILSRYVGWGGLADAFDESKDNWKDEFAELYATLSPEEYAAARASTLNAHYTSPTVIKAIYEAVGNMGFQTGNILEPSMGVGNFFGMLPESMKSSRLYGVELDSITGRIAKQLYPKADITVAGFETTDRKDFFDLAVGNVPFGQYQVSDRAFDKLGFSIHNYFFAKALDQVRPGGVVAFVTSRYTMDAKDSTARKYIAQRADLLGAIRLPNNAFKANAGTEVVSDILFLQKRDRPIDIEPDWVHLGENEDGFSINQYFIDHPEMVLGRQTSESTQYGRQDFTVEPYEDLDLATQLGYAIQNIGGKYEAAELPDLGENDAIQDTIPADPNVKNYSYAVVDGEVYYRENSVMVKPNLNATAKERVKGMAELRDCVHRLIDLQMWESDDLSIRAEQQKLNRLYDRFTEKYGLINSRGNALAFADDSSYYLLCSLEMLDDEDKTKLKGKADMFTKRTIRQRQSVTSVDTAAEALALSIGEKARVDMAYMSQLTGKSEDDIIDELNGVIFLDPVYGDWQTADEYLSGNVRQKLREAENAAVDSPGYLPNVEALRAAQPKDLDASEIEVRLGATWIDKKYIQQFMFELLEPPLYARRSLEVNYSEFTAEWNISGKNSIPYNDINARMTYGTDCANAYKILEDTLNLRDVRIYDTIRDADGKEKRVLNSKETTLAQQKQQAIKEAFRDWIWRDPDRRRELVQLYNERFNSTRPREYDGRHLIFPGMNPEITLREHQLNAIAHDLYGGNTLLAHEVGAGKTFEMIAAAMEGKRLGLCQKSLFAVPNHLTEQWASEFLRLYPSANILVATKKDFETRNRKKFCARIATGDYDAVIIGHSQFERIPVSRERQERLLQEQIWEIEDGISELKASRAERFTIKELERTKKNLEAKLQKLHDAARKDDVVTFEQLGVDRLYVDEAHSFKNLFLYTKMRNVAGLSTTDAQKSSDMLLKCRYIDELTHGKGVTFATGTPISNSMTELYTMMRYLQHDMLKRNSLTHFDCWASAFGETTTAIELAPEGTGYRARTRFAKFFNLPELMNLFREAADIKTADQLNLPTPTAIYHTEVTQPTALQQQMVQELSERAAKVHAGSVDASTDNMLKITSDGRKLGLDQRVINPDLPDDPNSKVNLCVNNIHRIWQDGQAEKLTQIVFCDLSTPKGKAAQSGRIAAKGTDSPELHALEAAIDAETEPEEPPFTIYDDIREKLVARGIPREQIAFIHEANTEVRKKELFAKVRSGQVRVLMGSTFKMGAGMNVQDRLVALHDLDCPWRPGDLEQRSGRIIRQGNRNKEVHIYRYVTESTFDAYLWQTVENKQKFISQIMTSKSPVRSCEDIDEAALSYAEIKALCAGDERIREKMDLDVDVARLRLMKANHQSQQYRLEDNILRHFPAQIEENKGFLSGFEADMRTLEAHPHPKDGFAGMEVKGDLLTDKDNAGAAILEAFKDAKGLEPVPIGSYRGFSMSLTVENFGKDFILTLKGKMSHRVELGKDARGNLVRIDNALAQMPERYKTVQGRLENVQAQLATAKAELGKPFPQEAELKEKSARLAELNAELNIDDRTPMEQAAENVVAKRPSVLGKLKAPSVHGAGEKKKSHEQEAR